MGLVFLLAQQLITDAPTATKVLRWGGWVTISAAIFLVLIAQYEAWSLERDKYEAELAKNLTPDIRGEFFDVQRMNKEDFDSVIWFKLYLCNHSQQATTIKQVRATLSNDSGVGVSEPVQIDVKTTPACGHLRLERGIGVSVDCTASLPFVKAMYCNAMSVPDTMEYEPRGTLSDLQITCDLVRTNAVLAVRNEPHSAHPLIESDSGILEDSAHFDRELLAAVEAGPEQARLQKRMLFAAAFRAFRTVRPLGFGNSFQAHHRVREIPNGINQTTVNIELFCFHDSSILRGV